MLNTDVGLDTTQRVLQRTKDDQGTPATLNQSVSEVSQKQCHSQLTAGGRCVTLSLLPAVKKLPSLTDAHTLVGTVHHYLKLHFGVFLPSNKLLKQ